jgi:6-phosphogluconolactonase
LNRGILHVFGAGDELYGAAAEEFVRRAGTAVREFGRFRVALSGGSTPRALYARLASGEEPRLPWDSIDFFWSDERHVPPDSQDSNYRMAMEALLSRVPVPSANIYRIAAEDVDARRIAAEYEGRLRTCFGLSASEIPRFDLILLGLGPEGHTASLFPGTEALWEKQKLVAANWVEKLKAYRITFTPPLINNASCVLFLVSGPEKAPALQSVLNGRLEPNRFPAQLIRPRGELLWLVDRYAAHLVA